MLACKIRTSGRGRHAYQIDLQIERPDERAGAGRCRAGTGLGQADRAVVARPATVGADRAVVGVQGRTRLADGEGRRSLALPAEQSRLRAGALPGPGHRRAQRGRPALPRGDDADQRQRALSRPDGRGELGGRARRARVHVPARPAGCRRAGAGRRAGHPGTPGQRDDASRRARSGRSRRRCRGWRRTGAGPRCPAGARRAQGCGRRQVHGAARRHAVEDRRRGEARRRLAGADAGRAVQVQRKRVRRQHEPPAVGVDPDHSQRRRRRRHAGRRGRPDRARAGERLAQLSRPRRRGRDRGAGCAGSGCRRQDRHHGRGKDAGRAGGPRPAQGVARGRAGAPLPPSRRRRTTRR